MTLFFLNSFIHSVTFITQSINNHCTHTVHTIYDLLCESLGGITKKGYESIQEPTTSGSLCDGVKGTQLTCNGTTAQDKMLLGDS